MSILDEPPQERRPIQTYVMENNPEFIREASPGIEPGRAGLLSLQSVETIGEEAFRVQNLASEANVAFAHGQMSERELETSCRTSSAVKL